MNAPDQAPDPFDDRLRAAYDFLAAPPTEVPPPAHLWAGIEAGLGSGIGSGRHPRRTARYPWRTPLLAGVSGVLLGLVLMWWLGGNTPSVPPPQSTLATTGAGQHPQPQTPATAGVPGVPHTLPHAQPQAPRLAPEELPGRLQAESGVKIRPSTTLPSAHNPHLTERRAPPAMATLAALPVDLSGLLSSAAISDNPVGTPVALRTLVQTETWLQAVGADTSRPARARRRAALLTQRAELTRLRLRADSLLLTWGEPGVVVAELAAAADSASASAPPSPRWSVALAFAPERNFFGLRAPAADTLSALRRTHEQGRSGYTASIMAQYRLSDRWSVGAGVGLSSYGAELRLTDRQTLVTVAYDTQTTQTTRQTQVVHDTYSIRIVQAPVLSPIFNLNQQIIGYETVLVPRPDTVWTHVVTNGTQTTTQTTATPTVTTRSETSTRILRPDYRFLAVPVLVRYRLGTEGGLFRGGAASRWWADVALGAQVQVFLGGTQLTSPDGRTWRTERVGAGGGPFRPLTVALTGAVALNYALTPRLSANVAPTLRYQTESVYKASTGLTQRPAATGIQLGMRLAF